MMRTKYPITEEAKNSARALAQDWTAARLPQLLDFTVLRNDMLAYLSSGNGDIAPNISPPPIAHLLEMRKFHLIEYEPRGSSHRILLLQELRNAVASDFEVSDFYLTTNAVGTIIYGNLHQEPGSSFNSAASSYGDVTINVHALTDEIKKLIGPQILKDAGVASAIKDLEESDKRTRLQKMGKVIQELGRVLEHLANAGTAIQAVKIIGRILIMGEW